MLDTEHKKLLDTITRTNEMVNEPYNMGTSSVSGNSNDIGSTDTTSLTTAQPDSALSGCGGNSNVSGNGGNGIYNDDEMIFVRSVDYKCIFDRCGMPLAVASIDGRLMDCNEEFVKLTGYRREELLPMEQPQQQLEQEEHQQQGSDIIADEVGSCFSPAPVFPDVPTASSSNINDSSNNSRIQQEQNAHGGNCSTTGTTRAEESSRTGPASRTNATVTATPTATRNFSLFNLLSRNHMEEVFVSLSEMLKHPAKGEIETGSVSKADYWTGNVRLSRNSHIEVCHVVSCHLSYLFINLSISLFVIVKKRPIQFNSIQC